MRKLILGAALVGLALAARPAHAQSLSAFSGASTIGSGAQTIVNTPVNTNAATVSFPGQKPVGFLASLFPSLSLPSSPLTIGQSNYPAPSSFPSTQYANAVPRPFVPMNDVPRYLLRGGYTPSLAPGR